ncbi:hypothetical protein BBP40_008150 [Aspergillus hancockii]|nr:hypothetical protein BBP40_008150 [Aspergillus hancockii]
MSRLPPEDNRYPPGPSYRPYPRRDDRDGRMYDDLSPSRSPVGITLLPILRALPHEGLLRIGSPIIPETLKTPDPVTKVETAMISDDGRHARLHSGEGDQRIGIVTGKVIAHLDITAGREVTVAVGAEARDEEAAFTDKKAER